MLTLSGVYTNYRITGEMTMLRQHGEPESRHGAPVGGHSYTTTTEDAPLLSFSKGRDTRFVEIFQRFLSLEPLEHEECMDTECQQ